MTHSWERNVEGLRAHAQQKAAETRARAEAAITQLIREQRPVNFRTVAQTAEISASWLYGNEIIKQRILHLRSQQTPNAVRAKLPAREQASSSSKDVMIAALRQRIGKLEKENSDLKRQVEVANGLVYQQAGVKFPR